MACHPLAQSVSKTTATTHTRTPALLCWRADGTRCSVPRGLTFWCCATLRIRHLLPASHFTALATYRAVLGTAHSGDIHPDMAASSGDAVPASAELASICTAYLRTFFHSVLWIRKVYLAGCFERHSAYGITVFAVTHPGVQDWIESQLQHIQALLNAQLVERISMILTAGQGGPAIEAWNVDVDLAATPPTAATYDDVYQGLAASLLKLMACEALVPPCGVKYAGAPEAARGLPELCWTILLHTKLPEHTAMSAIPTPAPASHGVDSGLAAHAPSSTLQAHAGILHSIPAHLLPSSAGSSATGSYPHWSKVSLGDPETSLLVASTAAQQPSDKLPIPLKSLRAGPLRLVSWYSMRQPAQSA